MTSTVFIDGAHGTTGLRLQKRLEGRDDVTLITLPAQSRKCPQARLEAMKRADITVLCLPDDASRQAVALADQTDTIVVDASSAHRVADGWVYGMPELPGQIERIRQSRRISVPGCHATGFILMMAPLVSRGLVPTSAHLTAYSTSGYTGGGLAMIEAYESPTRVLHDALGAPRPYALQQAHKHMPEMTRYAGLMDAPIFEPHVGDFACGMLVRVPLWLSDYGLTAQQVLQAWQEDYSAQALIHLKDDLRQDGVIDPTALSGFDHLEMALIGQGTRQIAFARYDNLGKGASGTAVAILNVLIGAPITKGLSVPTQLDLNSLAQ